MVFPQFFCSLQKMDESEVLIFWGQREYALPFFFSFLSFIFYSSKLYDAHRLLHIPQEQQLFLFLSFFFYFFHFILYHIEKILKQKKHSKHFLR